MEKKLTVEEQNEIERRRQICYNCENLFENLRSEYTCAKCACTIDNLIRQNFNACVLNKWAYQDLKMPPIEE